MPENVQTNEEPMILRLGGVKEDGTPDIPLYGLFTLASDLRLFYAQFMGSTETDQSRATVGKLLKRAGLRRTPGRIRLLTILLQARRPLMHKEILANLRDGALDQTSVYRALNSFVKRGLANRIETSDRVWRFGAASHHPKRLDHPHFECKKCGEIECLDAKVVISPSLGKGYQVEEQSVLIRGVCAKCGS